MPINLFKPKIQTAGNPYGTYKPPTGNPYSMSATQPVAGGMVITVLPTHDIAVAILGEEAGQLVRMEFAPEPDITAMESMRISLLIMTQAAEVGSAESALGYIRMYTLERHFKFVAVPTP